MKYEPIRAGLRFSSRVEYAVILTLGVILAGLGLWALFQL